MGSKRGCFKFNLDLDTIPFLLFKSNDRKRAIKFKLKNYEKAVKKQTD